MTTDLIVNNTRHATLSTTTADLTTFTKPHRELTVHNHDASTVLYFSVDPTNEVQTIVFSSWDAGDTIKFTHLGVESQPLTWENIATAKLQTILENLPSIGEGNVAVTRTDVNTYVATFRGKQAGKDVPALTCTSGTGSATGAVTETTKGGSYPATAVSGAAGTYAVRVSSSRTLSPWTGTKVSVVGSANIYSVEVF